MKKRLARPSLVFTGSDFTEQKPISAFKQMKALNHPAGEAEYADRKFLHGCKKSAMSYMFLLFGFLLFSSGIYSQNIRSKVAAAKSSGAVFQQVQLFDAATRSDARSFSAAVTKGVTFDIDGQLKTSFLNNKHESLTLEIPGAPGENPMMLELVRANILSSDFKVTTSGNPKVPAKYEAGLHYQGVVAGDPKSLVAISVFNDRVMGLISTPKGNYTLGKIDGQATKHILYLESDLKDHSPFSCGTKEDGIGYTPSQLQSPNLVNTCAVRIYLEVGKSVYDGFAGNMTNTTNFVTGLFNQCFVLYTNEDIGMVLSEIFVWTTTDPYPGTSTSTVLSQFKTNTGAFNGDLGHLLKLQNIGGEAAGFAGLCNPNRDESLCFSGLSDLTFQNVPLYTFNVSIITHEMGHLLGSRHTHACVWNGNNTAIDGCSGFVEGTCALPGSPAGGGTIMSYCHNDPVGINFNLGFGPQPGNVIRNNVTTAACLSTCCVLPTITAPAITQPTCPVPYGTIVVNATGSGALEYSLNNGAFQSSNTFTFLAPGSYNIKVRLQSNTACIATYSSNPVVLTAATGCCVGPTITAPTVTQPTCATPTGTIVVNATGTGTLEYQLNAGAFQLSNTFSGLAVGSYNILVRSQSSPTCPAFYSGNPVVLNVAGAENISSGTLGTAPAGGTTGTLATRLNRANVVGTCSPNTYPGSFGVGPSYIYNTHSLNNSSNAPVCATVKLKLNVLGTANTNVQVAAFLAPFVAGDITNAAKYLGDPGSSITAVNAETTFQTTIPANTSFDLVVFSINTSPQSQGAQYTLTVNGLACPPGTPTITTTGTLTAFTACAGTASAEQTFTVAGANLTANLTVTAPTGFEVSTTTGTGFGTSITPLVPSGGTVNTTTIFVRMEATATGTPAGNIACASTGATTQNVAASGTVNALPVITAPTLTQPTCATPTGTIVVNATGTGTLEYALNNGTYQSSATFSGLAPNSYNITVRLQASPSCIATYSGNPVVLTAATGCCTPPTITAPTLTQPTCATPTGTIVVNATGTGTLEYALNNGTYQSSATFSGLAPGSYNITVRLQASPACIATYSSNPVVLNAATGCCTPPVITPPTLTQPTCATPTGTIVVNATGSGVLEYALNNGTYQTNNTFSGLAPGSYNITVRLQANPTCIATYSGNPVVLSDPANINISGILGTAPGGGTTSTLAARLIRGGVMGTCSPNTYPTSIAGGPFIYNTHRLSNTTNAPVCVTVTINVLEVTASNLQVAAFLAPFVAGDITNAAKYLGDPGLSSGIPPVAQTFSVSIPANTDFDLVVFSTNPSPSGQGAQYSLTVTGLSGCCVIPTITAPTVTQPTCATGVGGIVVNATGGGVLEYALNNGTYQTSNTFSNLTVGNYNITVRLQASPSCLAAYTGNPVAINAPSCPGKTIPGRVEAEAWDTKSGPQYAVATGDPQGGVQHVVGIVNGSWMDYNVVVLQNGMYNVTFRVATTQNNPQFQVKLGATVLGTVSIPNTGGWNTWQNITVNNIPLTAGARTIRIQSVSNETCNFNWTDWVVAGANTAPTANAGPNQSIVQPASQVTLAGSGSANNGGTITSHVWSKFSGPAGGNITDPNNYGTTVTGLQVGTYVFRLTVTDNAAQTATSDVTIIVNPASGKFIPGRIEAEAWDTKNGPQYSVPTTDPEGGVRHVIGMSNGAWLDYNVNVTQAGAYTVIFRVATTQNSSQFQIKQGANILATVNIPNSSGWDNWINVPVTGVPLAAGVQTLRIQLSSTESCNFNWMDWLLTGQTTAPTANAGPNQNITLPTNSVTLAGSGTAGAGGTILNHVWSKFSGGAANITDPNNYGTTVTGLVAGTYVFRLTVTQTDAQTATSDVTITVNPVAGNGKTIPGKVEAEAWDAKSGPQYAVPTGDAGGGQQVVGMTNGSWLDYNVNVLQTGSYTVNFRVATTQNNVQFQIRAMPGNTLLKTVNITNTGGWDNWQTVVVNDIALTAGQQTIRIQLSSNESCNFNFTEWFFAAAPMPPLTMTPAKDPVQKGIISNGLQASVFPNPASSYFNLRVQTKSMEQLTVRILDIAGRQVQQLKGSPEQAMRFGDNMVNGTYFVEVRQGAEKVVLKVLKQ